MSFFSVSIVRDRLLRLLEILFAVGALCALWWVGAAIDRWFKLSIPAGVIGMAILLVLLATKVVPLDRIKPGSDWILAEMLLFFIPAVVGVIRYFPVLRIYGLRLLVALILGTICVLVTTALAVDCVLRLSRIRQAQILEPKKENCEGPILNDEVTR